MRRWCLGTTPARTLVSDPADCVSLGPGRGFDDALLGTAVLADGLDQVEVAVAVDVLFADEHAGLAAGLARLSQLTQAFKLQNLASHSKSRRQAPQVDQ